jgi:PEGA domain-containing protein
MSNVGLRIRMGWLVLALGALGVAAPGCETTRELLIDSKPQGADVYVNAQKVGQTPYVGPIEFPHPDHRLVIQVHKPGFWPDRQVRHKSDTLNVFVNLQLLPGSE